MATIAGLVVEISADNQDFVRNLRASRRAADSFARDSARSFERVSSSASEAAGGFSEIASSAAQAEPVVDRFGNALSEADLAAGRYVDAAGKVREANGKFAAGFTGSSKAVKALARDAESSSGRVRKALQGMVNSAKAFAGKLRNFLAGAVKAVAAGATAATAAVTATVTQTSLAMRDLVRDAEAVGTTARDLQTWQYAARSMGIEADKVGDVFKDVQDKVNDFVRTGGGEAADVFEQLGLNAQDFIGLAPDQALLRISSAMDGLTQGEKIFFMEALADDASRLIPLLDDNAERFNTLAEQGREWGNIMTEAEIQASAALGKTLSNAGKMASGFKNLLGANLAPTFQTVIDWLGEVADGFGGPREAAQAASRAIINAMASAIEGVSDLISWINNLRVALMKVQRIELATEAGASQVRSFVTGEGQTEEQRRLAEFDAEIARLESGETGADAIVERLRGLADRVGQTSDKIGQGGDSAQGTAKAFEGATRTIKTASDSLQGILPTGEQSSAPERAGSAFAGLNLSSITPMSQSAVRAMQASQPAGYGASAQAAAGSMSGNGASGGRNLGTLTLKNDQGESADFFTDNADAAQRWLANTLSGAASAV